MIQVSIYVVKKDSETHKNRINDKLPCKPNTKNLPNPQTPSCIPYYFEIKPRITHL